MVVRLFFRELFFSAIFVVHFRTILCPLHFQVEVWDGLILKGEKFEVVDKLSLHVLQLQNNYKEEEFEVKFGWLWREVILLTLWGI